MRFVFQFRSLLEPLHPYHHHHHHRRGHVDFAAIKHVRDRGLDHAVEREKHLKPLLGIKDLIKYEPSKSLPISIISNQRDNLEIPIRPIEFIRKYPFVFEEFLPGGTGTHPHIKLTPQVLDIDSEEQLVYKSECYRKDVADRLLKLLMISRVNKLPLKVVDAIKWDLGLGVDYVESLVPEFSDYFRVVGDGDFSSGSGSVLVLELVCWSNELAVSVREKKVRKGELGCDKGIPIAFPMQFSRGFQMDKKLKKWIDEWQKLPYVSPYENAMHLGPSSDESDKWVVGILHEVLNLFVSKKMEKDTLLYLGECLDVRSRFKRALLHHPGIFYLSSKLGTHTVVLREAYKRGLLIDRNPIVDIRNRYLHLMNMVAEDCKAVSVPGDSKQQDKKKIPESGGQGVKEIDEDHAKRYGEGSGVERDGEDDCEYSTAEEEKKEVDRNIRNRKVHSSQQRVDYKNVDQRVDNKNVDRRVDRKNMGRRVDSKNMGQRIDNRSVDAEGSSRYSDRMKAGGRNIGKNMDKVAPRVFRKKEMQMGDGFAVSSQGKATSNKRKVKLFSEKGG